MMCKRAGYVQLQFIGGTYFVFSFSNVGSRYYYLFVVDRNSSTRQQQNTIKMCKVCIPITCTQTGSIDYKFELCNGHYQCAGSQRQGNRAKTKQNVSHGVPAGVHVHRYHNIIDGVMIDNTLFSAIYR